MAAGTLASLSVASGSRLAPLLHLAVLLATTVAAWWCVHAAALRRDVWAVVALGLTATNVAGLAAVARLPGLPGADVGAPPDAWLAISGDAAHLGGLVLLLAGTGRLLVTRLGRRDLEAGLDVASAAAVLLLLLWAPTAATVAAPGHAAVARVLAGLCGLAAVAVVAVATGLAVAPRAATPATLLLGAAAVLQLLPGAAAGAFGGLGDPRWLAATHVLAACLVLAALSHPSAATCAGRLPGAASHAGGARLALSAVALLVAPVLAVVAQLRGEAVEHAALVAVAVLTTGAVLVRVRALAGDGERDRARLAAQDAYVQALASSASDLVVVLDRDGVVRDVSPTASPFGAPPADIVGRPALDLLEPGEAERATRLFRRAVAAPGTPFSAELRLRCGDGARRWADARVVSLRPDAGGAVVVNLHDLSARKAAERQLAHQAFHDGLTGLANRALLEDRLAHALRARAEDRRPLAVLYIDLDRFKLVNDSLGHEAGDELLRAVAARLCSIVRAGDTVARLGGDEFAVLVEGPLAERGELEGLGRRVLARIGEPLEIAGTSVQVGASVGIAFADADAGGGGSAERGGSPDLLRRADLAMYAAKARGRERVELFEPAMEQAQVDRLELAADLRHAVAGGQLQLEFQPLVRLTRGDLVGFESLLRWAHPTRGRLGPDRFLPIAEESGQIEPIGRWVLEEACTTAATWQRGGPEGGGLWVSVNLSAGQFRSTTLVEDVREALRCSGLEARSLVLELTESVLRDDEAFVAERLAALRATGARVGVDDVGASRSLLGALHRSPVDVLKLDRSLMGQRAGAGVAPVVRGVLELGRALDVDTVAQGVETGCQLARLRSAGYEMGQGFFLARPLSAAAATKLALAPRPGGERGRGAVA